MAAFLNRNVLAGGRPVLPISKPARLQISASATIGSNRSSSNGVMAPLPTITDIYGTTATLGPDMNAGGKHAMPLKEVEPVSAEVQALIEEQGIDFELSGLKYLSNDGRVSYPSFCRRTPPPLLSLLLLRQRGHNSGSLRNHVQCMRSNPCCNPREGHCTPCIPKSPREQLLNGTTARQTVKSYFGAACR